MKKFHPHLATLALLAALGFATHGALAQTTGDTASGSYPCAGGYPGKQGHHMRMNGEPGHYHQARFDALKASLSLSADQEQAWSDFAAAMQPPAMSDEARQKMREDMQQLRQMKTPERLEAMRERRAQMTQLMDKREEAIRTFYATLDETQQAVFDEEFTKRPAGGGMGPGRNRPPR